VKKKEPESNVKGSLEKGRPKGDRINVSPQSRRFGQSVGRLSGEMGDIKTRPFQIVTQSLKEHSRYMMS